MVWGLGFGVQGFGVCRGIALRRLYLATRCCRVHRTIEVEGLKRRPPPEFRVN